MTELVTPRELRNLRLCIRCSHMEMACICKEPVWVSQQVAEGKSIHELRKLTFKKVKAVFGIREYKEATNA